MERQWLCALRLNLFSSDFVLDDIGGCQYTSGRRHDMICTNCQRDIPDYSNFCYFCGARQTASPGAPPPMNKRLMRSATDRKIAGVCGGIAEYLEVDSTLIRLIWVLAIILPIPLVPAFLGYFVAWLIMPQAPIYTFNNAPQRPVTIPHST
jgi:phage shock protein C